MAEERLWRWETGAGARFRARILRSLEPSKAAEIFQLAICGLERKTASNYGAGILRYYQFCDKMGIPEDDRIPAPEYLLVAFLA